jgi:hypothetical protein
MKKALSFSSIILIISSMIGCKGSDGPAGPAGPALTGSLTGYVQLIQSDGTPPKNESGVNVALTGTGISTTTDSTGKWTISNLQTGTYTIDYTKTGYGEARTTGRQFLGGGTSLAGTIIMSQPPNFTVSFDQSKTTTDSNSITLALITNGVSVLQQCKVLIVFGYNSDLSASDPTKYLNASTWDFVADRTTHTATFYRSDLQVAGFTSGSTINAIAYGLNYGFENFYSSYYDPATNKTVYTSLGSPSQIIQVKVP